MDFTALVHHIREFHSEFNIDTSPSARADKLFDEVNEFATAMAYESPQAADDEAIDVLVCAISNCLSRGIANPLDACYFKLQRTAVKYRGRL
ncbi:MAG TPA: hypothetical protein DCZ63_00535 [Geobacter sp.]|nr:hypothetical protein [Geobacter sp.]